MKLFTNFSRTSPQNSSQTVTNETENIRLDREIPIQKRQHIIEDLINWYNNNLNNGIRRNINKFVT